MKIIQKVPMLLGMLVTLLPSAKASKASHPFSPASSSKVNLNDMPSLANVKQDDEVAAHHQPSVAELLDKRNDVMRKIGETNLRRRLTDNNAVQFAFGGQCVDSNYSLDNLKLYANSNCHGGWNQKFAWRTDTKIKFVKNEYSSDKSIFHDTYDRCWDSNAGIIYMNYECEGNLNEKWKFDTHGRMISLNDNKCVDLNGGDLTVANCDEDRKEQRLMYPDGFPIEKSHIKPFALEKCWDYGNSNLYLYDCHSGHNQVFYRFGKGEQIYVASGAGCIYYDASTKNVNLQSCDGSSNPKKTQQFYWDSYGRLRSRYDDSCLEYDSSNKNNIRMATCDGSDKQRLSVPSTFQQTQSAVRSYETSKCWNSNGSGNKIYLYTCNLPNPQQNWYYVSDSQRIMEGNGQGCVAINSNYEAVVESCDDGNDQKFSTANGRLSNVAYPNKCLTPDADAKYLVMKDCDGTLSQEFAFPDSLKAERSPVKAFFKQDQCWDINEDGNALLSGCISGNKVDFIYNVKSLKVLVNDGDAKCLDGSQLQVKVDACDNVDTEWTFDIKNRLRSSDQKDKCLTADETDGNKLVMSDCSNESKDNQIFLFPDSVTPQTSVVTPYTNTTICWSIENGQVALTSCNETTNQNFLYVGESERIVNPSSGLCMEESSAGANDTITIGFSECQTANNQKWSIDSKHRVLGRQHGHCLDVDTNGKSLQMTTCSDEDSQRFIYPDSFTATASPVTPYADPSKCWTLDDKKHVNLGSCDKKRTQDFIYIPETTQVIVATGDGCLDFNPLAFNLFVTQCTDKSSQKWSLDALGRITPAANRVICINADSSSSKLSMMSCQDVTSQKFSYPNSFPIVSTDASTAYNKRQSLNKIYGQVDQHIYGKDSRSILRYKHPDQVKRNLCPYWTSDFVFKYTMQNYQLSTPSVLEVKDAQDMKKLLTGGPVSSEGSILLAKPLAVWRPQPIQGYFSLGDAVSNDATKKPASVLVNGEDGATLQKPKDYELVWKVAATSAAGAFWKPLPEDGYTCLGHVWATGDEKPSTDLIRCLQDTFVETAPSTWAWDNNAQSPSGSVVGDASLWTTGATTSSITAGTFVSKASYSAPVADDFKALKKKCILGLGSFPFCAGDKELILALNETKEFSLPYAKLKPCYYSDEDQTIYGLANDASSDWESHAFELHQYNAGNSSTAVGYKSVAATNELKEPYCLGSVVFGSSAIQNDMFIHNVTAEVGSVSASEVENLQNGNVGNSLTQLISGDFVFLFPCFEKNDIKSYKELLQEKAADANQAGLTENGLVNAAEELGGVIAFGDPKWIDPHYCGKQEEPTATGGCKLEKFCFFEPGGCKPYDQQNEQECKEDDDCKGDYCSKKDKGGDGLCGYNLKLYALNLTTSQLLPRAVKYGVGQDDPGNFLAKAEGNEIELKGNVWKAFPISQTIAYNTVLQFDFRLQEKAEGHAICLDEDLNEDVEIKDAKRCFRLAGTQGDVWTEVWNLDSPGTGEYTHYKIHVGSLIAPNSDESHTYSGAGDGKPYIAWGTEIKYLALVQDNDANENVGKSSFKNIQLYDDRQMPEETVEPGPSITGNSITINVKNSVSSYKSSDWQVSCTRLDFSAPDLPPSTVYGIDGTEFKSSSDDVYKHDFTGLRSGFQYTFKVNPVSSTSSIQTTTATTYCCCDCDSIIAGDTSGRPIDMKAYQVDGHVLFNFTDNSRCAEAYAFTRSELNDEFFDNSDETRKGVFTPNYNFYPKKKCGKAPVVPGRSASDDLKVSQLIVGKAYRYCVRAVAKFYSADSLQSSDESCNIHYVRWQASMAGKITTDPTVGGSPIEGVAVSWELWNPEQTRVITTGSALTKRAGKFSIDFDESDSVLNRDDEYPVRIKFSKTTTVGENDVIKHQFLCNDGATDCTDDGTLVYLKHLDFDEPIVSYDNSSVPVRGKITIWEADGCPVQGAEVCLKVKHTRSADTKGACVKTDQTGSYTVPAAIGSTVGIEASYHNNTFIKAPENSLDYDKGLLIQVGKLYENNNFVDISKAKVFVEVAGGLCNKTLGTSSIEATVSGCKADQWKKDLSQKYFKDQHLVPAHQINFRVTGMSDSDGTDFAQVMSKLSGVTQTIDLRGKKEDGQASAASADDSSSENDEDKSQAKENKVRFQYDGDLQLDFRFVGRDDVGACPASASSDPKTTTSLHVTPTGAAFKPMLFLTYQLLPDLTCDVVSEDLVVRLINKVGVDADFKAYADKYKDKKKLMEELKLCSDDGGCDRSVGHFKVNEKQTEAHMVLKDDDFFVAGRPNINGDHRKDLTLEVLSKERNIMKRHKAEVVVTGDYVKGPGASFALPTYKPIMILRDPPGGLSSASYENVQTTIKVKSSSNEVVQDIEWGYEADWGVAVETEACAGFGAMACTRLTDTEGKTKGGIETTKTNVYSSSEDSYTSEFTTTWSYETSDDPMYPGRQSDVIVIPNLNVQYYEVENIKFESCKADMTTTVKFSLTDAGNKPTLSFLTVYSIENHQMKDLEKAIKEKEEEAKTYTTGSTKRTAAEQQQKVLEDALKGWNETMTAYEDTNKLAKGGNLTIAGRQWFDKWAALKDLGPNEPSITSHWANLAPGALTDRAQAFTFDYITEAGLDATDKQDLKETNRIQFVGGGGTTEFAMTHAGASELLSLDDFIGNGGASQEISFGVEGKTKVFGALADIGTELKTKFEWEYSSTVTNEADNETSISFVVGDEQQDDSFVVDLYIDDTYGTFVFHTVSGQSSCPHEPDTLKGEDLIIEMERPSSPVMADEAMLFEITLQNNGLAMNVFQSFVDHTTNSGGLKHYLGGMSLEVAIDYQMNAGTEVKTTLELRRGPKGYKFSPTVLNYLGAWDEYGIEAATKSIWNFQDAAGNKWIKFEEPCPAIEWAGDLKREMKASVVKEVKPVQLEIYNPSKEEGKLTSLAANGRLENVFVFYREVGDTQWVKALSSDGQTAIDFASNTSDTLQESTYGYASFPWNIESNNLADGTYEVEVKSICTELSGAPVAYNSFATEPILLVVDRVQPELYGKALPIRDIVFPGEEVAMIFTEPIRCDLPYQFDLEVKVSGLDTTFDKDNLRIDCSDRKLAFQFDPVSVKYDLLLGKAMTVTVGNVKDLEGNLLASEIVFTKTIAKLNLEEASSTFYMLINTDKCDTSIDTSEIRGKVSTALGFSDSSRINIPSTFCSQSNTVAEVRIGPSASDSSRRLRSEQEHTALSAYYSLMDISSKENDKGARKLMSLDGVGALSFAVDNLELHPGEGDVRHYGLNSDPTPEEEIILAAAEGCDRHQLEQRSQMHRVEEQLNESAKETKETASHINELEMQLEILDHKLDRLLVEPKTKRATFAATSTSSGREGGSLDSADLEELLLEMRAEQQQARAELQEGRIWNMLFGVCALVAVVASMLSTRSGR